MKRLTILATAALAAVALTASVGTASASASETALCSSFHEGTCPSNEVRPAGAVLAYGVGSEADPFFKLSSSFVTFECFNGFIDAVSAAEKGSPLPMTGTTLLMWNCGVNKGNSCDGVQANKPNSNLVSVGGGKGDAVLSVGTSSGLFEISFQCTNAVGSQVECSFKSKSSFWVNIDYNGLQFKGAEANSEMVRTAGNNYCLTNSVKLHLHAEEDEAPFPAQL